MNKLSLGLSIVTCASLGVSIYFFDQLQTARENNARLGEQLATTMQRRDPGQHVDRTRSATTTSASVDVRSKSGRASDNNERPATDGFMGNRFGARMMGGPFGGMSKQDQKLRLMRAYPDLAATLHLSPAEVDKLFDVLADYQTKQMQLRDALRDKNLARDDFQNQLGQQYADAKRNRDQQIASTLGTDKNKQWQDYENTLGVRTQIRELGTILESSGYPLREDQVQTLVDALVPEQDRYRAEQQSTTANGQPSFRDMDQTQRMAMFEQNIDQLEKHTQATRDTLSTYLTAEQLQRYDEISAQQIAAQRANLDRVQNAGNDPSRVPGGRSRRN